MIAVVLALTRFRAVVCCHHVPRKQLRRGSPRPLLVQRRPPTIPPRSPARSPSRSPPAPVVVRGGCRPRLVLSAARPRPRRRDPRFHPATTSPRTAVRREQGPRDKARSRVMRTRRTARRQERSARRHGAKKLRDERARSRPRRAECRAMRPLDLERRSSTREPTDTVESRCVSSLTQGKQQRRNSALCL